MSDTRHAVLAWALLLSLLASFYVGVWIPLQERTEHNHDRIASLAAQIEKLEALKATKTSLSDEIKRMQLAAADAGRGQIIQARSSTLGNADLQRHIQTLLATHQARQISNQPSSEQVAEGFYRLQQSINLSGTLPSMQRVLFDLERGRPRVFIDKILVSARNGSKSRRLRAGDGTDVTELSARLSVSAYMEVIE